MSLFSAFGQKGLAVFTQTMENISSIVAPIPEDGDMGDDTQKIRDEIETDEEPSFDNFMSNFISTRRDELLNISSSSEPPESPNSMVEIDLGDQNESTIRNVTKTNLRTFSDDSPPVHIPMQSSAMYLDNDELKSTAQIKYRQSLEDEISSFDSKYRDLKALTDQIVSERDAECDALRVKLSQLEANLRLANDIKSEQSQREHEVQVRLDCAAHKSEIAHLISNNERYERDNDDIKQQLFERTTQLDQKCAELQQMALQHRAIQQRSDELHMTNYDLQNKLNAISDEHNTLLSHNASLQKELNEQQQSVVNDIDTYKIRCESLADENRTLRDVVAESESKQSQMQLDIDTARDFIKSLEAQLSCASVDNAAVPSNDGVDAMSAEHREEKALVTGQLSSATQQIQKLQTLLDQQETERAQCQAEIDQLTELNRVLQLDSAELSADIQTKDSENRIEMNHKIDELTSQLSTQTNAYAVLNKQLLDLQFSFDQVTQQLAQSVSEHNALKIQCDLSNTERRRLDEALTASHTELSEMEVLASTCKAEASELLFALQLEQDKTRQLTDVESALNEEISRLKSELASAVSQSAVSVADRHHSELDTTLIGEIFACQHIVLSLLQNIVGENDNQVQSESISVTNSDADYSSKTLGDILSQIQLITSNLKDFDKQLREAYVCEEQLQTMLLKIATEVVQLNMVENIDIIPTAADSKSFGGISRSNLSIAQTIVEVVGKLIYAVSVLKTDNETLVSQTDSLKGELLAVQNDAALKVLEAVQEATSLKEEVTNTKQQIDRLTTELQSTRVSGEQRLASAVEAKNSAETELQRILSSGADSMNQLSVSKKETMKLETENRQLHQVIAQLRQVRKTTKGEEEGAIAERDELRTSNAALSSELTRVQGLLSTNTANADQVTRLRAELSGALNKCLYLEQAFEDTKRQLSALESSYYHKQSQLDIVTSDLLLVRQDLDQRSQEVNNLMSALAQIQKDSANDVARIQRDLDERTQLIQQTYEANYRQMEAEWLSKLERAELARAAAEQQSEDHELFRRKAELDFNAEKKKVQKTLENALLQLNNSQQDVIDRAVIANLIVSYFKRKRAVEVMELIAKVLSFNDEQKVAVGLKVAPTNLISSLFAKVIGPSNSDGGAAGDDDRHSPDQLEGDNLAEQWINFLITQAEENSGTKSTVTSPKAGGSNGINNSSTVGNIRSSV